MFNMTRRIFGGAGQALGSLGSGIQSLAIGQEKSRDLNSGKLYDSPLFCSGVALRSDGSTASPSGLGYEDPAAEYSKSSYKMTGKDKLNRVAKYGMWGIAGISWLKFAKDPSFGKLLVAAGMTLAALAVGKKLDNVLQQNMENPQQTKEDSKTRKENKKYKKELDKSSLSTIKNKDGSASYLINYDKHDKQNGGLLYGSVKVDKTGKPVSKLKYSYNKNHQLSGVTMTTYDQNGQPSGKKSYTPDQFEKLHPGIKDEVKNRNAKTVSKMKAKEKSRQTGMSRLPVSRNPLMTV